MTNRWCSAIPSWMVFATSFAPHSSQLQLLRISILQQVFISYTSLKTEKIYVFTCEAKWLVQVWKRVTYWNRNSGQKVLRFKHGHNQYRIIYSIFFSLGQMNPIEPRTNCKNGTFVARDKIDKEVVWRSCLLLLLAPPDALPAAAACGWLRLTAGGTSVGWCCWWC